MTREQELARLLMKWCVLGGLALIIVCYTVNRGKTDEVNLTYQEQVRTNSDAIQAAQLALTRMQDADRSLRTYQYYQCKTDDGYGRTKPCSMSGDAGSPSGQ